MRLLITPSNPAYAFVVIDTQTGVEQRIGSVPEEADPGANDRRPAHRPYGITWDTHRVYVANRRNLCVYNHRLEYRYSIRDVLGDNPHQLAMSRGTVIGCATDRDALVLIDPTGPRVRLLSLREMGGVPSGAQADSLHVNSVLVHAGKLYVGLHNRGRRSSQVLVMDEASLRRERLVDTGAYAAHNLFVRGAVLGTLDTAGTRKLLIGALRIDLRVPEDHFLRGMAASRGRIAVAHFPQRQRRYRGSGDATIKVLEAGRIVAVHSVEDIGAVNDMRLLCDYDYCHHNPIELCP